MHRHYASGTSVTCTLSFISMFGEDVWGTSETLGYLSVPGPFAPLGPLAGQQKISFERVAASRSARWTPSRQRRTTAPEMGCRPGR